MPRPRLLLAFVAALAVAGCGGNTEETGSAQPATTIIAAPASTTSTTALRAAGG